MKGLKFNRGLNRRNIMIAAIILILIIAVSFTVLLIQEHWQMKPTLEEVLDEKLTAYETDLKDSLVSMETNADVTEYLLNWAKNKDITAEADTAGNVIYTLEADEPFADTQPAALFVSFDASDMGSFTEEIAVALTAAKNAQNNGPFHVIFLAEENRTMSGIQSFDMNQFPENTAVFCLDTGDDSRISTSTGGYKHIHISSKLSESEPSYNKAYKVTLKNCPKKWINEEYDGTLNPLKNLGSVLANFKSTSLLFELAEFSGGSDRDYSPSSASMTIVINDSDTAKFERKMNSSIEKFMEKYGEDYPDLQFTYETVALPASVITNEDTDNLVGLMYTIFNGVYHRNEEGTITTMTNIGRLSTDENQLNIDVAIMGYNSEMLQEVCDTYETICGLCDVNFEMKAEYPLYDGSQLPQTEELLNAFEKAYGEFTGERTLDVENTAVLTECTFIHTERPELPLLFFSITSKTKHEIVGSLVTWLDQSAEEN